MSVHELPQKPFRMPGDDEPKEVRIAAYNRVNAVRMTVEQLEQVMTAGTSEERYRILREMGFGDLDLVLHAMDMRWQSYVECRDEGGCDWKTEDPEYYARMTEEPIDPGFFDLQMEDVFPDWADDLPTLRL